MFTDKDTRQRFDGNDALWIVAQSKCGSIPVASGFSGQGKTVFAELFAQALSRAHGKNFDFLSLILSQQMPEDAGGMKYPGQIKINGTSRDCVLPMHSEEIVRAMHSPTVVFLDEVNQCQPATMAANQELWFNNPPENAIVFGAMNPIEYATDGFEFPPAMINRLCMLEWEFDDESWDIGMSQDNFPDPDFPILVGDWSGFRRKWAGIVAQFKKAKPQHFNWSEIVPAPNSDEATKPWRSPRSWRRAAICLGAAEAVGASRKTALKILTGFIGEGPALEFFAWLESLHLPSSEELYYNPNRLNMPPSFDAAVSLVSGVYSYCKIQMDKSSDDDSVRKHFERGLDFCEAAFMGNREVGSSIVGRFVKLKPADYAPQQRSHPLWDAISASRSS